MGVTGWYDVGDDGWGRQIDHCTRELRYGLSVYDIKLIGSQLGQRGAIRAEWKTSSRSRMGEDYLSY